MRQRTEKTTCIGVQLLHNHLRILLALPMLIALFACATVPAAYAEPTRVVFGFDREFPPFTYEEAGGTPVGFEVDLLKAIFAGQDVVLSMRPLSWDMVQLELSSGAINVTSGMVKTEQRNKLYLFSEKPSFPLQIRLFTKVYNRFPSAQLLRGQFVSVEKGTYQHRLLEKIGGFNIKPQVGKVEGIRALFNDEVAAYCGPMQSTYYYINKLNYGAITSVGTPLGITEMRFAVNRGRGDIHKMLNTGLQELINSGEYDRIYRKWFVRELEPQEIIALQQTAKIAAIPAYTPYHMQAQGAAVLSTTGKVYSACSVENAQEDLSISALRAAIVKAIGEGDFELRAAIIVSADGTIMEPTEEEMQSLYEFGRGILLVLPGATQPEVSMVAQKLSVPIVQQTNTIDIE